MKEFKIMGSKRRTSIPWALIASHEARALSNHGQTLSRLNTRGGLSSGEAVAVLENRGWEIMIEGSADDRLDFLVDSFLTRRGFLGGLES